MAENLETVEKELEIKVDQEKVDQLTKLKKEKEEELNTKLYLIAGKDATADKMYDFFTNKVQFNGPECAGVIEIVKIINEYRSGKPGKEFMLNGTAIHAIYHFLSTFKGSGLKDAEDTFTLFDTMQQALGSMDEDRKAYQEIVEELQCVSQGIEMEA